MKKYELYLILNPILGNEGFKSETESLIKLLESKVKALNISSEIEGIKKLAYPIKKSQTGCYLSIQFDLDNDEQFNLNLIEKALNIKESVIRYIITNLDEYMVQEAKQVLNTTEIKTHNVLNKKENKYENKAKKCIIKHLGYRVIDYKNVELLEQFMSPYGKIFGRERTGVSAKYQRKITKAIKRSRHMALLPFTALHMG